jgi:hypothetical protein
MLGVNTWRILSSIAPAVASVGLMAGTGLYIKSTPKDSDIVQTDLLNNDTKTVVAAKLVVVRKAAEAIMEAKKKGTVGPDLVKQLVDLDEKLDKAVQELLATGATITADVQTLVAVAMKVRMQMLTEEELLTQLTKDVDYATKLTAQVAKLAEGDANRVLVNKYLNHMKSRYDPSGGVAGVRITDKLRPKWDAFVAIIPTASKTTTAPTTGQPRGDVLNPAAIAKASTDPTLAKDKVSQAIATSLKKAKSLEQKYKATSKRNEKLEIVRQARVELQKLKLLNTSAVPAESTTAYNQAKALYDKLVALSP